MTTQTTTSVIDHTSDSGFRAWVAELIAMFIAAGLVQTSDTGQIDTSTVTRPATNTEGGYAVFRFDDSRQGAAPIFLRFGFGTGSSAALPRLRVTVGTASNGSGTVSGQGISVTTASNAASPGSAVTNYTTRVCVVDGFFGLFWKLGAAGPGNAYGFIAVCRSVDASGAATAEGAAIYTSPINPSVTMARYSVPASVILANGSYSLIHGGHATSLVGGAAQVFKHYLTLPKVSPNAYLLTVLSAELGSNVTFTAKPVGSTSRTFISSGAQGVQQVGLPQVSTCVIAMIWE